MQKKFGKRITRYRETQGLSRADLAERTGLDESFIAAMEEEGGAPSLGPLLRVARALGVRLGTFIDDDAGRDIAIVRAGEREQDALGMHTGGEESSRQIFHSLGAAKADRHMEPFFIQLRPPQGGAPETPELSSHEGEEFIVVTVGRVDFRLANEAHVLEPGDSIYFNSIVPHYIGCHGEQEASIYAVLYLPR